MTKLIQIKNRQFEAIDLLNLKESAAKVTYSGRRFSIKDKDGNQQKLKYNDILQAVLNDSELKAEQKTKLLKRLVPLQNAGHKKFGFFKNKVVKTRRSWGATTQKKLLQEASPFLSKKQVLHKKSQKKDAPFDTLPQELIFSIFNHFPVDTSFEILDAIQKMRLLSHADKDTPCIFGSISAQSFAAWMLHHRLPLEKIPLSPTGVAKLKPFLNPLYNIDRIQRLPKDAKAEDIAKWIDLHLKSTPLDELPLTKKELAQVVPFLSSLTIENYGLELIKAPHKLKELHLLAPQDPKLIKTFKNLRSLSLTAMPSLKEIAPSLPHLVHLFLWCMALNGDEFPEGPFSENLKSLHVGMGAGTAKHELGQLKNLKNLQNLHLVTDLNKRRAKALSQAFSELKNLQTLSLFFISDGQPMSYSSIALKNCGFTHSLKKLNLFSSRSRIEAKYLEPFTQLEALSLSVSTDLPKLFKAYPHLKELSLNSKFTGKEFKNCAFTHTLKKLTLCNKGEIIDVAHLTQFTHLTSLNLSQASFNNEKLDNLFQSLPHLKELNVNFTNMTGNELENCAFNHSLQKLSLTYCSSPPTTKYLKNFTQLKELDLDNSYYNESLAEAFAAYSHLTHLCLSDTKTNSEVFKNCAFADTLLELDLSGCLDLDTQYLHQFTNLKKLDIENCGVSQVVIDQLKKNLPDCLIFS